VPRKRRRGSALLNVMIVMMVTFALGSAFLDLSTQAALRGRNDVLRAQALNLAEAGVQKALYYLRGTAPNGTTDGSWRTPGRTESLSGRGSYTIVVQDGASADAGEVVIEATGRATIGSRTVKRLVRAVVDLRQAELSIRKR
jgi:type II secretory pathway component PulK